MKIDFKDRYKVEHFSYVVTKQNVDIASRELVSILSYHGKTINDKNE